MTTGEPPDPLANRGHRCASPPSKVFRLPSRFRSSKPPPSAPPENSTTHLPNFQQMNGPPPRPPSYPRNRGRRSFLARPASPAHVEACLSRTKRFASHSEKLAVNSCIRLEQRRNLRRFWLVHWRQNSLRPNPEKSIESRLLGVKKRRGQPRPSVHALPLLPPKADVNSRSWLPLLSAIRRPEQVQQNSSRKAATRSLRPRARADRLAR